MGVGPVTASAVVATVGNFKQFINGSQFGAWLGLTPRQNFSGGKNNLGSICLLYQSRCVYEKAKKPGLTRSTGVGLTGDSHPPRVINQDSQRAWLPQPNILLTAAYRRVNLAEFEAGGRAKVKGPRGPFVFAQE